MSPADLTAEDLPGELDQSRMRLLLDLHRLWMRQSDLRFGQLIRAAADIGFARPGALEDVDLASGVTRALTEIPDRPPPAGPYWDTETRRRGSFIRGFPRDPARIPQLIKTLGRASLGHPELQIGQVLELALDRAGIPQNEFGTRWLLMRTARLSAPWRHSKPTRGRSRQRVDSANAWSAAPHEVQERKPGLRLRPDRSPRSPSCTREPDHAPRSARRTRARANTG